MKWIDEVAYALAVRYAKKNCVTKFVDDIEFLKAIHIGDLVFLTATLIEAGKYFNAHSRRSLVENLIEQVKKEKLRPVISFL